MSVFSLGKPGEQIDGSSPFPFSQVESLSHEIKETRDQIVAVNNARKEIENKLIYTEVRNK